jgi:ribosomal protein L11 methyltransferase
MNEKETTWWEVTVGCTRVVQRGTTTDEWGPDLIELGAEGIVDVNNEENLILCYVYSDNLGAFLEHVASQGGDVISKKVILQREWLNEARAQFPPIECGRLKIIPIMADEEAHNLTLDAGSFPLIPGTGFGSGHHPSTYLALELMQDLRHRPELVLDFGSGSGILSVASYYLYAPLRIYAVDNDLQAIENTKVNVTLNGLVDRVMTAGTLDTVPHDIGLVVANVYREVLLASSTLLCSHLLPGGTLILSGFQADDVFTIETHYKAHGLSLIRAKTLDGWHALVFTL